MSGHHNKSAYTRYNQRHNKQRQQNTRAQRENDMLERESKQLVERYSNQNKQNSRAGQRRSNLPPILLPEDTCHPIWAPRNNTNGDVLIPTYYAIYPSKEDADKIMKVFHSNLESASATNEELPLDETAHDMHAKLLHRKERVGRGGNLKGMMDFIDVYDGTNIDVSLGNVLYNCNVAILQVSVDPTKDEKHKQFCDLFQYDFEACDYKDKQRNMPLHILLTTNRSNRQQNVFSAVLNLLRDPTRKTLSLKTLDDDGNALLDNSPIPMTIDFYGEHRTSR